MDIHSFVEELKKTASAHQPHQQQPTELAYSEDICYHAVEAPTAQVAHVIGLRGEKLAALNNQSGATIRVIHGTQRGKGKPPASRLDIQGPQAAVAYAVELLEARLAQVRSPRRIECERAFIGKVIGRNGEATLRFLFMAVVGERVKDIQDVSGASIQVDQRNDPCIVEVSGNPTQIIKAADLVIASMEGRYASSYNRLSDIHSQDPIIDPYKDIYQPATSAAAAAAEQRLWFPARDDSSGRVYWYHAHTGQTQWENPYGGVTA